MTGNSYFLKYDKLGDLYSYKEKDSFKELKCKILLKDNLLFKADDKELNSIIEYETGCTLMQRFECGESWVSVIKKIKKNNYAQDTLSKKYKNPEFYHNIDNSYSNTYAKLPVSFQNYTLAIPNIKKSIFFDCGKINSFTINNIEIISKINKNKD